MNSDAERDAAPRGTGATLKIDIAALQDNYRYLSQQAGSAVCAAVIKANGYGLGIENIVSALRPAGCEVFFVALAEEAQRARLAAPDATIYVLDGLLPGSAEILSETEARPVLGSLDEIDEWAAFCRVHGRKLPAAVHIDTGMNRLGLPENDVRQLAETGERMDDIDVSLIMTHLACADQPEHPMNREQLVRFEKMSATLPAAPRSAANSAGVLNGPAYSFDLVRPGIAIYGGNPRPDHPNPMKQVVELYAFVLQIRHISPGETVGYGARFTAARATRVAILALGYADGVFRHLGGDPSAAAGQVFIADKLVPVIGRISMDLIAVDITDIPADQCQRGSSVEILGRNITIDDAAAKAGTIGYEILTNLSQRYHRVYLNAKPG